MVEKSVGTVTHWYDKIGVAVIKLSDTLKSGDRIKIKQGEEEFEDVVSSIQVNYKDVSYAKAGDEVAVKLSRKAKEGSVVYLAPLDD